MRTPARWVDGHADTGSTDLAEAATHINSALRDITCDGAEPDLSSAHLSCAAPIIRNRRLLIEAKLPDPYGRIDDFDLAADDWAVDLLWRAHTAVGHAALEDTAPYYQAKFLRVAEAALRTYWRNTTVRTPGGAA